MSDFSMRLREAAERPANWDAPGLLIQAAILLEDAERQPARDGQMPAFPISIPGVGDNGAGGIVIRDFFAAKALPAIYVEFFKDVDAVAMAGPEWRMGLAGDAYLLADAMLAARKQGEK